MGYKIIGDSCLDLTEALKKDSRFETVPLTLQVDEHMVVDDETFDQKAFIGLVKASPNCPKSACPSPEAFKKAYECEEEDVFVITLSSHLSGSCNSARVGKELYEEELDQETYEIMAAPAETLERCQSYISLPAETRRLYNELWITLGIQ